MPRHNRTKPHRIAERDRDAERHARRIARARKQRTRPQAQSKHDR